MDDERRELARREMRRGEWGRSSLASKLKEYTADLITGHHDGNEPRTILVGYCLVMTAEEFVIVHRISQLRHHVSSDQCELVAELLRRAADELDRPRQSSCAATCLEIKHE